MQEVPLLRCMYSRGQRMGDSFSGGIGGPGVEGPGRGSGIEGRRVWNSKQSPVVEGSRHKPGKAGGGGAMKNLPHVLRIWDFTVSVIWSS